MTTTSDYTELNSPPQTKSVLVNLVPSDGIAATEEPVRIARDALASYMGDWERNGNRLGVRFRDTNNVLPSALDVCSEEHVGTITIHVRRFLDEDQISGTRFRTPSKPEYLSTDISFPRYAFDISVDASPVSGEARVGGHNGPGEVSSGAELHTEHCGPCSLEHLGDASDEIGQRTIDHLTEFERRISTGLNSISRKTDRVIWWQRVDVLTFIATILCVLVALLDMSRSNSLIASIFGGKSAGVVQAVPLVVNVPHTSFRGMPGELTLGRKVNVGETLSLESGANPEMQTVLLLTILGDEIDLVDQGASPTSKFIAHLPGTLTMLHITIPQDATPTESGWINLLQNQIGEDIKAQSPSLEGRVHVVWNEQTFMFLDGSGIRNNESIQYVNFSHWANLEFVPAISTILQKEVGERWAWSGLTVQIHNPE